MAAVSGLHRRLRMTAYSIFCASSQFIAIHWGTLNGSLLFTTQKGFLPSPLKWLRLCWLDKLVSGTCISWPYSIPELFSYSGIINRLSKTHFFLIFRNIWAFLNAKGRHLLSAWELPPNTVQHWKGLGQKKTQLWLWPGEHSILPSSSPSSVLDQIPRLHNCQVVPFRVN